MFLFEAKIYEKEFLARDTFRLRIAADEVFSHHLGPGKFVMLGPQHRLYDPLLLRPFGICNWSAPWFEVIIKIVGRGTEWLSQCRTGDLLRVHGPLGNGYPEPSANCRSLLLVAGGIGIASLASWVLTDFNPGLKLQNFKLLYGATNREQLILLSELQQSGGQGFTAVTITDDGSCGRKGLVTSLLQEELLAYPNSQVFACGPEAMLKAVAETLKKSGNRNGFLSLEKRMACGFGVCLGCVQKTSPAAKYRKVCTDGPVFPALEVDFDG